MDQSKPQPSPDRRESGAAEGEQRYRGPDRRKRATPRFSRYSLWGGRRKSVRREEEREGSFVDLYGQRLLLLLLWVALMNVADSFFTLPSDAQDNLDLKLFRNGRLLASSVSTVRPPSSARCVCAAPQRSDSPSISDLDPIGELAFSL